MARCDLQIELEGAADTVFRLGDTISGSVEVGVDRDVDRQKLVAKLLWKTHGRGNSDEAAFDELELYTGPWSSGEHHTYPFQLTLPEEGPYTYRGEYLNVDWYVEARSDIPWARDPRTSQDFLVRPGDRIRPEIHSEVGLEFRNALDSPVVAFIGVAFAIVSVASGLYAYLEDPDFWVAWVICAGLGLAAAGVLGPRVRRWLASRRIGDVQVTIGSLDPDGRLACEVGVGARDISAIRRVNATLILDEVVTSGSGTNRSTHTHRAFESEVDLPMAGFGPSGRRYAAKLELPEPPIFSFSSSDNKLRWNVEIRVDVSGWPDWKRRIPFELRPPLPAGGTAGGAV